MKKCPYCAEEIQDAAIVCRYCGRDLAIPPPVSQQLQSELNTKAKKNAGGLQSLSKLWQSSWLGKIVLFAGGFIFLCLLFSCVSFVFAPKSAKQIQPSQTADMVSLARSTEVVVGTNATGPGPKTTPTNTLIPTLTPMPTHTPTATNGPLTATAEAKQLHATQTAYKITVTAIAKANLATQIAGYDKINVKELVTYSENHKGEKVVIRGRIFNIISNTQFQLWIDGGSYDAVYVVMAEPYNDIFEETHVTVYGTIHGQECGQNAFGGDVCLPMIIGDFYKKK